MSEDLDREAEYDEQWAKIEEAVAPLRLEPHRVGEVLLPAIPLHPLSEQIFSRTGAGERFRIRLMEPDREAIEAGEQVPVMVQVYLAASDAGDFISVMTTNAATFAANPPSP